ncbi:CDP-archaeol synthase [Inquilinus sp. OTU3971]|uniref:CDP-archaeol synthase n=1 Tax=Inquilinus sp. OTU3971 TaxID=3043855 RepID=UPI00313EC06C
MEIWPILRALALLAAANGAPVLARKIFGGRWSWPLDFGVCFFDGRPLLGRTKTIRGIAASMLTTALVAVFMGLDWTTGGLFGLAAMAGDLLSSFAKRRLALPSSSQAPGLDQVPESLIPLVAFCSSLGLSIIDVVVATLLFWVGELILSRQLYRLGLRDRPY